MSIIASILIGLAASSALTLLVVALFLAFRGLVRWLVALQHRHEQQVIVISVVFVGFVMICVTATVLFSTLAL